MVNCEDNNSYNDKISVYLNSLVFCVFFFLFLYKQRNPPNQFLPRVAGPGRPVLNVSYHLAPSFAYLEQVLTAHCVASIGGNGVLSWVLHFWNGTARKWTVRDRAKEYLDGPLLLEYDVLLHDYGKLFLFGLVWFLNVLVNY